MSLPHTLLVALAIFLAALGVARMLRRRRGREPGDYRLRHDAIFTRGERAFMEELEASLPRGVRLFGKVRLGDIFTLSERVGPDRRMSARGRINQKHVDFLLVRADDLSPLAGVELDDRTHAAHDRRERDAFVDSVFSSGGLPLLHFPARAAYDRSEIRGRLAAVLR